MKESIAEMIARKKAVIEQMVEDETDKKIPTEGTEPQQETQPDTQPNTSTDMDTGIDTGMGLSLIHI